MEAIRDPSVRSEPMRDCKKRLKYLKWVLKYEKGYFIQRGATAVAASLDIEDEQSEIQARCDRFAEEEAEFQAQAWWDRVAEEEAEKKRRLSADEQSPAKKAAPLSADQTAVAATAAASSQQPLPARSSEASTDGTAVAASESSGDEDELRRAVDEHVRMLASRSVSRR